MRELRFIAVQNFGVGYYKLPYHGVLHVGWLFITWRRNGKTD